MIIENMQIEYKGKFLKMYKKAPNKVQQSFKERLRLFKKDAYLPLLNNHQLTGKYIGYKSINITGNWRAIFKEGNDTITFYLLGTHPQLYV